MLREVPKYTEKVKFVPCERLNTHVGKSNHSLKEKDAKTNEVLWSALSCLVTPFVENTPSIITFLKQFKEYENLWWYKEFK